MLARGDGTMDRDSAPKLSAAELSSATEEPIERLRRLQSLELIGSEREELFAPEDVERVRLIQFLERRRIEPEAIARAEQQEAILSAAIELLFPDGPGRTYSLAEAADTVGLDPGLARRLRDASGASDEPLGEHDLQMLRHAKPFLGPRECWLRDPDGYTVVLASPDGSAS